MQPEVTESGGPGEILRQVLAFYGSRAVISAVELDLFTVLAEGPLDATAICGRVGLHARGARDFLDTLVSLGLLARDGEAYRNSAGADQYLDRRKASYLGGYALMANHLLFPVWSRLTEALRTGAPQVPTGGGFFDGYRNEHEVRSFLGAMDAINGTVGDDIAREFDWAECTSFVDLGGARGNLAARLVAEHPHLRGTCFDLPQIEPFFHEHVAKLGMDGRITFHVGDFFVDDLPRADAFILGHILHYYDQEQREGLLKKVFDATNTGGAVLIYDRMIDDDRRGAPLSLLGSLNMLLTSDGGREYTPSECRGWLTAAGFMAAGTVPVGETDTLVVGRKVLN
ncbi:methyltransferase [Gandjariella thermophila]|uniref:O-methyltransferase n=1 Tax=Gandjariella thermophila TaxID=1931992 RepID=A0A4D4JAQ3_9PSEU|nr:methyltransferase [Gandjariella thermophila]GDY31748.1 O-methyltransferase [Gandjariella thermophila]